MRTFGAFGLIGLIWLPGALIDRTAAMSPTHRVLARRQLAASVAQRLGVAAEQIEISFDQTPSVAKASPPTAAGSIQSQP